VKRQEASDKQANGDLATLLRGVADIAALSLPLLPRLAPWLTLVDLGDGRLQLRASEFAFTVPGGLFGEAARHLCPLLDGTRSVAELTESGSPLYLPGTIFFLLQLFHQRGALQEGTPTPALPSELRLRHSSAIQLFAHYVADAEHVLARLSASRVVLMGAGSLISKLEAALVSLGVGTVANVGSNVAVAMNDAKAADLFIAASDTLGSAFFDSVNSACLDHEVRWLRIAFEGRFGIVGPTIVPRQTACFTCYNVRRASHDVGDEFLAYRAILLRDGDPHEGAVGPFTDLVAAQASLEAARLLTGFAPPATFGRFYTFEAGTPKVDAHEVLRVPRCPACGRRQSPRDPWDMRSRLRLYGGPAP
jgi:bacteriocin biosynthesis cyclodehydratase domain-containing protein